MVEMTQGISPASLPVAVQKKLKLYAQAVREQIDRESAVAIKRLVQLTKQTAPVGTRMTGAYPANRKKDTGRPHFVTSITSKKIEDNLGYSAFIWYVKGQNTMLTTWLERGHKASSGSVAGTHFLEQALQQVLPDYQAAVEEVIRDASQ